MTTQKSFKRRVRDRMAKTGESYTAARRQLLPPDTPPLIPEGQREVLMHSEAAVRQATGHGWEHWVAMLDDWGATGRSHSEIASWLMSQEVPGWWAQGIAVSYERLRGMRAVGETAGGFTATASKTIAASADRVFDAFEDPVLRGRWLPGVQLRTRTATRPRSIRYDWQGEDGASGQADGSRVIVGVTTVGVAKATVAIQHERLADTEEVARFKELWRARLGSLKDTLEEPVQHDD